MPIDFTSRRAAIDAELERLLGIEKGLMGAIRGSPPAPALAEAMAYSLLAPGKRLRPMLCLLACEAAGGAWTTAVTAGCAIEMVHTYSLIHDDLPAMDDDDLRRGLPTCHVKFGEALAILAGDALLTLAFGVLAESHPHQVAAECCRELAAGAGAAGMVAGQVLDLEAERRPTGDLSLTDLQNIHALKTGKLFRASLRIGHIVARGQRGIDPVIATGLEIFGQSFGLAFQITDDLLDVEGSSEVAGKRTGKDAGRNKLTYPGLLGIPESRRHAEQCVATAVAAVQDLGPGGTGLTILAENLLCRAK